MNFIKVAIVLVVLCFGVALIGLFIEDIKDTIRQFFSKLPYWIQYVIYVIIFLTALAIFSAAWFG